MKLSDLFIALVSVLSLSFTAQIRADMNSFNALSIANGFKSNPIDPIASEGEVDLVLRDAVNLALLCNPELAAFVREMRALERATAGIAVLYRLVHGREVSDKNSLPDQRRTQIELVALDDSAGG